MTAFLVVEQATQKPITQPHLVRVAGWTLERYLQEAPENAFWEFVRGEVVLHSPVRAEHQRLVRFLTVLLQGYCTQRRLNYEVLNGPAGLRVADAVVREPDLFLVKASRAQGFPVEERPLLVVEVISPSTRNLELVEKAHDYALAAIPEYWAVDPELRRFHLHTLQEPGRYRVAVFTQGRITSQALPGFWLDVTWLWQQPLPPEWEVLQRILEA